MPSLNGTRRRHTKQSSSSKKSTSPSVISNVSGDSASSNATVTSRSIFHSSLRPSKRPGAKKVPVEELSLVHSRSKSLDDSNKENLDVFAFMEHDEDEYNDDSTDEKAIEDTPHPELSSSSSPSMSTDLPQKSPRYSDLEVRAIQDGVQRAWGRRSLHSDSGISVRSSSPDADSPVLQHKLPTVYDGPSKENDTHEGQLVGTYGLEISPDPSAHQRSAFGRKHWPSLESNGGQCPEAYYAPSPRTLARAGHSAGSQVPELYPRPTNQLVRGASNQEGAQPKAIKSGYEYLASNIDSRDDSFLKPIYRKFEMLNNRMLLYLQDEISEMEDQLQELDAAIAQEQQENGENPASRRAEAKLPSQLQWHRLELLGRSFAKVEQYNRALTSYSNLTKSLEPASYADISAYRTWISEHAPIVEQEAAFLQREADLLTVSPSQKPAPQTLPANGLETPVIVAAFALVSTIIVFKVVPQILARLVISAMVGIASLCTLSPGVVTSLKGLRERGRGIALYTAVMLTLAIVVS